MSTNDTWILVSVPSGRTAHGPLARRAATRLGLLLLAWADRQRRRPVRAVDLEQVERSTPAPRPFC